MYVDITFIGLLLTRAKAILNQARWYYFFVECDHLTIPLYPLKYPANFSQSNSLSHSQKNPKRNVILRPTEEEEDVIRRQLKLKPCLAKNLNQSIIVEKKW